MFDRFKKFRYQITPLNVVAGVHLFLGIRAIISDFEGYGILIGLVFLVATIAALFIDTLLQLYFKWSKILLYIYEFLILGLYLLMLWSDDLI
jgi:hypothetical protein